MIAALSNSRRCVPVAAKAGGSTAGTDDLVISMPVGAGGSTTGPSVVAVQKALNNVPVDLAGPFEKLAVDGIAGSKTIQAINEFQQRHFGFRDGRVDVMGKTHAKLSSFQPSKLARMQLAKQYLARALNAMRSAQTMLLQAGVELLSGGGVSNGRNLTLSLPQSFFQPPLMMSRYWPVESSRR